MSLEGIVSIYREYKWQQQTMRSREEQRGLYVNSLNR